MIEHNKNYLLYKAVSNLAKILWWSDLAIISGGTLMYEACILGTPTITICQNQNKESEFFAQNNAVINLRIFNNINKNTIPKAILELISDYKRRKQLSKNAKQLMPLKGTSRIADITLKEHIEITKMDYPVILI